MSQLNDINDSIENPEESGETAEGVECCKGGEEVAHCPQCMAPLEAGQYYCANCGYGAGNLTPYIPFVNISFTCRTFKDMWRLAWFGTGVSFLKRLVCLLLVVALAPVMLLGLPFVAYRVWRGSGNPDEPKKEAP